MGESFVFCPARFDSRLTQESRIGSRIRDSQRTVNLLLNGIVSLFGTLHLFPVFISPVVWNMCEHLYESVYFKELHKEQEYRASCSVNYY